MDVVAGMGHALVRMSTAASLQSEALAEFGKEKKVVVSDFAVVAAEDNRNAQVAVVVVSVDFHTHEELSAPRTLPCERASAHTSAPSFRCQCSASPVDNSCRCIH